MYHPSVMAAALSVCALLVSQSPARGADTATVGWRADSLRLTDSWNTFTADMRITRTHVKRDGTALGTLLPDARYRVERSNRSGSWKTVTTVLGITQPAQLHFDGAAAPAPPVVVQRLEDDENGAPLRVYDVSGRRVGHFKNPLVPTADDTTFTPVAPRSTGREWINRMVLLKGKAKDRLRTFDRAYGQPVKSGGTQIYTSTVGALTKRVVVDPVNGVALEYTETRAGVPTMRVSLRYGPAGTDAVVRLGVRSEVSVSPDVDDVVVLDSSYSNVALAWR